MSDIIKKRTFGMTWKTTDVDKMAATSRVSFAQDGGQGNVRIHPYLAALLRWCVSSVWTTATVLLHRLMTAPHLQISGPKPKPRPATSGHLHPEPLVECVVLHQPPTHTLDVIFVHGLYGSLANTWRQGEWRSNYGSDPIKVSLRRPDAIPTACCCSWDGTDECTCDFNKSDFTKPKQANDKAFDSEEMKEEFYPRYKVLPEEEMFITEKFYNNMLDSDVGNYDTQAGFVRDMFQRNCSDEVKPVEEPVEMGCKCKDCQPGCGCICDRCYSPCWPRDWVKVDYPGARVISINYTSDPYLWRPLWIKESKRQRLHERAEQMMKQLLDLGVGDKPIVWVGHSKGGLFIKQVYCEAYEAYLKTEKTDDQDFDNYKSKEPKNNTNDDNYQAINDNISNENASNEAKLSSLIDYVFGGKQTNEQNINNDIEDPIDEEKSDIDTCEGKDEEISDVKDCETLKTSSYDAEDLSELVRRANLWKNSAGFMFYSVPHRGSPLADIKTPITARSVELLEICKDCPLVVDLQERWLKATFKSQPPVSSLVETCKTLMSLLWLRIVSVDSADPGIGTLSGVSVDHREICKPSSRKCLLYRELKSLIKHSLDNFQA